MDARFSTMSGKIWAGRVFVRENQGGNYTGVVLDKCSDPAALAADLGFPDTGFVQLRSHRSATIRTFSPYEELAQCLQTTLATPVALGAEDGQTWLIRHPAGELTVQVERSGRSWLCWVLDTDTRGAPEPVNDLPAWFGTAEVHRVPQGRSRLYARLPDVDALPIFDATDIREVCRAHHSTAVVFFAESADSLVRTRVFTTSLGGHEDVATGGAAAGVGAILARDQRNGRIEIVQGPDAPGKQGHLLVSLDDERHIGGHVLPLLTGTVAQTDHSGQPLTT